MANRGTAALVIACLLVSITLAAATAPVTPRLVCNKVYGVQDQETCFAVAQATGLSLQQFFSFNPNINCRKLFVGQWVCLDASPAQA